MDNPHIELHYGPYEAHGVIRHKIQRLHGITDQLTKLGYSIEFIPSIHLNRLTVQMKEREIFRCDIRNLLFNMYYMDDKVGHRLVAAVEEARKRMYDEDNIPKYDSLKEGMRLLQRQRDAKVLQELLVEGAEVMYEIPLYLVGKNFTYKSKKKQQNKADVNLDEAVSESQLASKSVDVETIEDEREAEVSEDGGQE